MSLRPLILDDAARAEADRVRQHAETHHYFPGDPVPGDDSRFVARFGTYRAVFTLTHADGLIYRHLSISVPSEKYPNPAAAFMIAELFGFTGRNEARPLEPGPGWIFDVNKKERCIVIMQPIASDVAKRALS